MSKDGFNVAAEAAMHVIEGDKAQLTQTVSRALNDPELTNAGYINALTAVDDLDSILDAGEKARAMPFDDKPKSVADWNRHYGLPTDPTAVNVARTIGQRLQTEYVSNELAARLKTRDKTHYKDPLPPARKDMKPISTLRADLNKALKKEGY